MSFWITDLVNFMITNWNKGNGEDGGEGDAKNNNGATHIDTKKEYPKIFESIPLTSLISNHIEKTKKELECRKNEKRIESGN